MAKPYTPASLADRWGCSTTLIYDLLNSKQLPGFKLGKLWRIKADAVEAYECNPTTPLDGLPDDAATAPPTGPSVSSGGTAMDAAAAARLARLIK
ncbi:helix-turn-helix domain-containing protein [Qipengyuania qiaonensis]|uniref:helix-turn-helix domain-containing protein n=1 Tax=Qipengyuania qiaonensis TaxID=2867240 RepID=UPI001FFC8859|nr:helix-turn-helix domain-containing protein [Qipengyuania qiaonensis]